MSDIIESEVTEELDTNKPFVVTVSPQFIANSISAFMQVNGDLPDDVYLVMNNMGVDDNGNFLVEVERIPPVEEMN